MVDQNTLVFFDLETGGLNEWDPNIQLAAIAVDGDFNELGTFERKIQFDFSKAYPEALKMNHWDANVWADTAISEERTVIEFTEFLKEFSGILMQSKRTGRPYRVARLAGHNVLTFDMPRLQRMYAGQFMPAHPQPLDTLALAMWIFRGSVKPENNKLATICQFLDIDTTGAHDALSDVRMSAAIAKSLTRRIG